MKTIPVNDLKKVDPTRYIAGDVFISEKQIGILHNGSIEPLVMQKDLKGYVKKTELPKLIAEALKKEMETK